MDLGDIMGKTCCTGRSKPAPFPNLNVDPNNERRLRKASYLEETSDLGAWHLQGSNDLKYDLRGEFTREEQREISLVLQRYGGKETAKALSTCFQLSIAGQRTARSVLFTTEAVYICSAEHLPNIFHRLLLSDIYLISVADNLSSAMLHSTAINSDIWLTGTKLSDMLKVIQKLRFDLVHQYIPYETVTQRGSLRYRLNSVDPGTRTKALSDLSLQTAALLVRFGDIGEQYYVTQNCITEKEHRKRKCVFLLSNKAVYTVTTSKVERIPLNEIVDVKTNGAKVYVTAGQIERGWVLPASVTTEIQRRKDSLQC